VKQLMGALVAAALATPAAADNVAITLTGSSLPGLSGTKTINYTLSDTDLQAILDWARVQSDACIQLNYNTPPVAGFTANNVQIMQCWVHNLIYSGTKTAVQQFHITPAVVPPPIGMAPGTGAPPQ
jgi:hypothetical protein